MFDFMILNRTPKPQRQQTIAHKIFNNAFNLKKDINITVILSI